jgi:hypothetical protein
LHYQGTPAKHLTDGVVRPQGERNQDKRHHDHATDKRSDYAKAHRCPTTELGKPYIASLNGQKDEQPLLTLLFWSLAKGFIKQ